MVLEERGDALGCAARELVSALVNPRHHRRRGTASINRAPVATAVGLTAGAVDGNSGDNRRSLIGVRNLRIGNASDMQNWPGLFRLDRRSEPTGNYSVGGKCVRPFRPQQERERGPIGKARRVDAVVVHGVRLAQGSKRRVNELQIAIVVLAALSLPTRKPSVVEPLEVHDDRIRPGTVKSYELKILRVVAAAVKRKNNGKLRPLGRGRWR